MEWTNWYKTDNVVVGDDTILTVYPRDMYDNNVTNATLDNFNRFDIDYKVNDDNFKKDILDICEFIDFVNDFDCKTKVIKVWDIKFKVEYEDKNVNALIVNFIFHRVNIISVKLKLIMEMIMTEKCHKLN